MTISEKKKLERHTFRKLRDEISLNQRENVEKNVKLYVDYIFLDTQERQRFSQVAHEYLIEVVQTKINKTIPVNAAEPNTTSLNALSHPVKELIWVIQPNKFKDKSFTQTRGGNQNFNFTDQYDYSGFTGACSEMCIRIGVFRQPPQDARELFKNYFLRVHLFEDVAKWLHICNIVLKCRWS